MVTTSQAAMQHSIEDLHKKFRKDQEETAEQAAKKAHLNEWQFQFNEEV